MNYLKVFRIVLITDSVVSVLKLALPIYLVVYGVQWKQRYDKKVKDDSSNLDKLHIILHFMGTTLLFILILFRLVTNYYGYRKERQGCRKMNCSTSCCWGCCCGCCWFTVWIFSIALMVLSIRIQYWINEVVALSFLCWDIVIFCTMVAWVIFKSLMNSVSYPHVVQYERHNSKEEINA